MTRWVLGLDFGTSFTTAAVRVPGREPKVLEVPAPMGSPSRVPSGVFARESGELVAGWLAENEAMRAPERFERTPKRRLGEDELLVLGERGWPVAELVAAVLRLPLAEARRHQGGSEPEAVWLTHPASWAQPRVDALAEAAQAAGIAQPLLLPEPVAAAVHFADERLKLGDRVAVYDLGGGTFDTAVVERTGERSFDTVGRPGGKDGLGGERFDQALYSHLVKVLREEAPADFERLTQSRKANSDFRSQVRVAKEALSQASSINMSLPAAFDYNSLLVTRDELEGLIHDDVAGSVEILAATIRDAGLDPEQPPRIYLAGGSSRIPLVARLIGERFQTDPETLDEPKTVVAIGAAKAARTHYTPPPLPTPPPPHAPSLDLPPPGQPARTSGPPPPPPPPPPSAPSVPLPPPAGRPIHPPLPATTPPLARAYPPPGTAAPGASGPRASFGRRLVAALVDSFLVLVVLVVAENVMPVALAYLAWLAAIVAYYGYLEGSSSGQTVGKKLLGIRVIDLDTGGPIGFGRGVIRLLARIPSSLPFYLGFLWMLWDPENQTWHDKLAKTVVVPESAYPVARWP